MRRLSGFGILLFGCSFLIGCEGRIEIGGDRPQQPSTPELPEGTPLPQSPPAGADGFVCDPSQMRPAPPLRRLSHEQYVYTITDLTRDIFGEESSQILAGVDAALQTMPADSRQPVLPENHGGFRIMDQALQQQHVDGGLDVARALGRLYTADQSRLVRLVGECVNSPQDSQECVNNFIASFHLRSLRRPASAEDIAFYQEVYEDVGISTEGFADIVTVMLAAPQFVYHVEHGSTAVDGLENTFELDAWERIARLSYHFWQSLPDAELRDAALDATIMQEDVWRQQVQRVYEDPKTQRSVDRFFREWLWLDDTPEMDGLVGTPRFDAFAGENTPSAELRGDMIEEVLQMARWYAILRPGNFDEMFSSPLSFATSQELADIYGVSPWNTQQDPPAFLEEERTGLYTRAAFLATGVTSTRPVMKGYHIRQALLCTVPPPPDDNAADAMIDIRDNMTTREVVEEITEQPGTSCASCHLVYLNHLGYPTESFDAMGRHRTHETLYDANGNVTTRQPVNTQSRPHIRLGQSVEVSSAAELTPALLDSGLLHACFSRQYLRFALGRAEDLLLDGCALEAIREKLVDGTPLDDVLMEVAFQPEFTRIRFAEVAQ